MVHKKKQTRYKIFQNMSVKTGKKKAKGISKKLIRIKTRRRSVLETPAYGLSLLLLVQYFSLSFLLLFFLSSSLFSFFSSSFLLFFPYSSSFSFLITP
ncbi:hypothetical protein BZA77DRAFT_52091 [Pyronema omphalodes]|nr:hypothetical protein BZA77DRAFT_52091 [Pyronema omphalodes]